MSRRREYVSAQSSAAFARWEAVIIGAITLLIDLFPVADAESRLWIGLAGALFLAGGIWLIRSPSLSTRPFATAPLGVGYLVGGPLTMWLLSPWPQRELPSRLATLVYTVLALITIGGWHVLRATWRLSTDLKDALEVPPTPSELTQERFEDLVNEIRGANMETDPAHIRFTSSTNMQARTWDGRLRDVDAVLTWTVDARSWGRDGSLVVSKDEFRILAKRSWFSRSSRRAKVFIGRHRFDGWISREAAERYERWKAPFR
jgi:hypothetical protein